MLGCIQPMSSPMMNRMLGFCVVCAALGVEPQPIKKLEMARAPSASFRTTAAQSIVSLLQANLVGLRQGGMVELFSRSTHERGSASTIPGRAVSKHSARQECSDRHRLG